MDFPEFFQQATDNPPYDYQRRLASGPCQSQLINIPTGLGKTAAVILAWLWNRVHNADSKWPRRLVYCLPMRTLVEQTREEAKKWIDALHKKNLLPGKPPRVVILMGGEELEGEEKDWDLYPEGNTILIGTQDMLLSRALNRGYGMSRYRWPMHFGLLNNDALWVFDEVQLMGSGLPTTAQLVAFRKYLGTSRASFSWWMSATSDAAWLRTVDFDPSVLSAPLVLEKPDLDSDAVRKLLRAEKMVSKSTTQGKGSKLLAAEIIKIAFAHQTSGLTLVVVNTVKQARALYAEIRKQLKTDAEKENVILLHSQFRPQDRSQRLAQVTAAEGQRRLVISTQIIEAGVDLSAAVLFTEMAPWSSLVQRFGRCNRRGKEQTARIILIEPEKPLPYTADQLTAARIEVEKLLLAGGNASPANLGIIPIPSVDRPAARHVIRRKDFVDLFDTTTDLSGQDIDIDRWVREIEDRSVQFFWREWDGAHEGHAPAANVPSAHRKELCPAPIKDAKEWLKKKKLIAWRWDFLEDDWTRVEKEAGELLLIPGHIYLLSSKSGGYSSVAGFDPAVSEAVQPVSFEMSGKSADANDFDQVSDGHWQSIAEHTNDVCKELEIILRATEIDCPALAIAARWHDLGKSHEAFQAKLRLEHRQSSDAKTHTPIAKAPNAAWKHPREKDRPDELLKQRKHFRHEVASALAVLQPCCRDIPDVLRDLVAWLIATHHGKVRLCLRSLPGEEIPDGKRFARGVWDGDRLPPIDLGGGAISPTFVLSLEPMELGLGSAPPFENQPSWAQRMLALRDAIDAGPLRLAYWESLLRAADERASAKNQS